MLRKNSLKAKLADKIASDTQKKFDPTTLKRAQNKRKAENINKGLSKEMAIYLKDLFPNVMKIEPEETRLQVLKYVQENSKKIDFETLGKQPSDTFNEDESVKSWHEPPNEENSIY